MGQVKAHVCVMFVCVMCVKRERGKLTVFGCECSLQNKSKHICQNVLLRTQFDDKKWDKSPGKASQLTSWHNFNKFLFDMVKKCNWAFIFECKRLFPLVMVTKRGCTHRSRGQAARLEDSVCFLGSGSEAATVSSLRKAFVCGPPLSVWLQPNVWLQSCQHLCNKQGKTHLEMNIYKVGKNLHTNIYTKAASIMQLTQWYWIVCCCAKVLELIIIRTNATNGSNKRS